MQDAFYPSPSVLVASMHHAAPGFYPGTGHAGDAGAGRGRGFTLNLPLASGLRDDSFLAAFNGLTAGAVSCFRPGAAVLQLGADGLTRDPVALLEASGYTIERCEQRYARGPKPWSYFTVAVAVAP